MLLKDNRTGKKACYKTTFKHIKTFKYHCFYFKAFNSSLNSFSDKYNTKIYKGDVCEVFIRYGKENHYYEAVVAPNGTIFLSDITQIDEKFSGQLIDKCFIKANAKIKKNSYKVRILIPKNKINTKKLEFNAFRIETDGEIPEKHLFALHPTLCDTFHVNKLIY